MGEDQGMIGGDDEEEDEVWEGAGVVEQNSECERERV